MFAHCQLYFCPPLSRQYTDRTRYTDKAKCQLTAEFQVCAIVVREGEREREREIGSN